MEPPFKDGPRDEVSTAVTPWPHCGGRMTNRLNAVIGVSTAVTPWPHCGVAIPRTRISSAPVSTAVTPWPHCGKKLLEICTDETLGLHGGDAVAPLRLGNRCATVVHRTESPRR